MTNMCLEYQIWWYPFKSDVRASWWGSNVSAHCCEQRCLPFLLHFDTEMLTCTETMSTEFNASKQTLLTAAIQERRRDLRLQKWFEKEIWEDPVVTGTFLCTDSDSRMQHATLLCHLPAESSCTLYIYIYISCDVLLNIFFVSICTLQQRHIVVPLLPTALKT